MMVPAVPVKNALSLPALFQAERDEGMRLLPFHHCKEVVFQIPPPPSPRPVVTLFPEDASVSQ